LFPQLYVWTVALYWITNPGKPWKVFVANRVKKMVEITGETAGGIVQRRRIWQIWEAEELESTSWRQEGGLQVPNGYKTRSSGRISQIVNALKTSMMNTNLSRKDISTLKSTSPMNGKHCWRETNIGRP